MSKIFCIGDVHGEHTPFKALTNLFKEENKLTLNDVVICLGDFGANFFFNHIDYQYKKKLGFYNITYFVIRGNHEQRPSICAAAAPEKWHTEDFWGNTVYVENSFPYIKYALDEPAKYEIPTAQGTPLSVLTLPGAYSVDKHFRIKNDWPWFSKEQLTEEEMEKGFKLSTSQSWDLVLSHTAPCIYEPTDLFSSFVDQSMVDKTMECWLGNIESQIDYKLWCWGHFHSNRIYPHYNDSDCVMLYNDCCVDIYKYFCGNYKIDKCLIKTNSMTTIDNFN